MMSKSYNRNQLFGLSGRLLSLSPHSVLFPFYHAVSNNDCPHLKNLYRVINVKTFENDLEKLLRYMNPVSCSDAIANFEKKRTKRPSFHLSFDDGLRESKEVIAPILTRKGIPATFFITTGFTNNNVLFYRHKVSMIADKIKYLSNEKTLNKVGVLLGNVQFNKELLISSLFAVNHHTESVLDKIAVALEIDFNNFLTCQHPYLNANEIIDLKNAGFSIGVHSIDHPEFSLLTSTEIENQVLGSVKMLHQLTDIETNLFSFPFTDYGIADDVIEKLINEYNFTTFGTAGIKNEPIKGHFQRIPMETNSSNSSINLISNEIVRYRIKKMMGRHNVKR